MVILALLGCGGGGTTHRVCGNSHVEPGEDCDNGAANGTPGNGCSADCTFVNIMNTSLQVAWKINNMAAPMFPDEPCYTVTDQMYQAYARVTLTGPVTYTDEYKCSDVSYNYVDQPSKPLPPGDYMVTARLIERELPPGTNMMDLTSDISTPMAISIANMAHATTTLNFTYDKFINQNRQGNLFFETFKWQPMATDPDAGPPPALTSCASASVARVRFYLKRNGQPVTAMTTTGLALDGTAADCHTPAGPTDSYQVQNLPWGPYDLVIAGFANQGASQLIYCSTLPIFVGAGGANPTYQLTTEATTASVCP